MAKLYVTEFQKPEAGGAIYGEILAVEDGTSTSQVVTFTTTTQSTAFAADTTMVRLYSDTDCFIEFGTNPTATGEQFLPTGVIDFKFIPKGASFKVAASTT